MNTLIDKADKYYSLDKAIEITKEYGRAGYSQVKPEEILDKVYRKILELREDAQS